MTFFPLFIKVSDLNLILFFRAHLSLNLKNSKGPSNFPAGAVCGWDLLSPIVALHNVPQGEHKALFPSRNALRLYLVSWIDFIVFQTVLSRRAEVCEVVFPLLSDSCVSSPLLSTSCLFPTLCTILWIRHTLKALCGSERPTGTTVFSNSNWGRATAHSIALPSHVWCTGPTFKNVHELRSQFTRYGTFKEFK